MAMERILCLGRSFTGSYLASEFPVQVRFLGRKEEPLDSWQDHWSPDLILDTIPAIHEQGQLRNPLYREELQRFPSVPFVHISSTSVYPIPAEGLLEADEMCAPGNSESCRRRLEVEESILKFRPDALILRAGGLYGPGRSLPLFVAQGRTRFFERGDDLISRIHVHDLCRLALAAGEGILEGREWPGHERSRLINAVDPHPSSVSETRLFLQELYSEPEIRKSLEAMGLQPPDALPEPLGVQGRRLVRSLYTSDLIGRFRFPDYAAGFRDSILRSRSP